VELQNTQQTHRLEHLCNVHLKAALKLDEQPANFWMDFTILWPKTSIERKKESISAELHDILQPHLQNYMAILK